MSEMTNLVSLYATVVTIVLFFQGLEIGRWSGDLQRLKDRRERNEDELLTNKRAAETYLAAVDAFRQRFPGLLGWTYVVIQAVLAAVSVLGIVPAAFPQQLVLAELPFVVLGLVCVVLWPALIMAERRRLNTFGIKLRRRHNLA